MLFETNETYVDLLEHLHFIGQAEVIAGELTGKPSLVVKGEQKKVRSLVCIPGLAFVQRAGTTGWPTTGNDVSNEC